MAIWFYFIIACSLVIYGGIKLTQYGDQLEDTVGLSAGFIGVFLLAATTSLPEFVASFSSIYIVGAPQLSLGNIFGSNTFNLTIIAVLDLFFIREVLYHKVNLSIIKTVAVGLFMSALALVGIYLNSSDFTITFSSGKTAFFTCNIFLLLVAVTYFATFGSTTGSDEEEEEDEGKEDLRGTRSEKSALIGKFILSAAMVVAAGIWITDLCDKIATSTGLGQTFVGSIFLAFATSLPEATVCATALKMRSYDLVFGNVLGSNIFNLMVLALTDIFTPHMAMMQIDHIELNYITGLGSVALYAVILLAMFLKDSRKKLKTLSAILIAVYIGSYWLMFIQQRHVEQSSVQGKLKTMQEQVMQTFSDKK